MTFDFDTHRCPVCTYIISDIELKAVRYDYGCPFCKTPFANFTPQPKVAKEEKGGE